MKTAVDSSSNGVALDVPAIQGVVGAKVSVKPSNASNSTITFASTDGTAVTFGFKAVQLTLVSDIANGKLTFHDVLPSGDIAFGVPQVAVFGSSSPLHTPPLSDKAQVLWLKNDASYQPPLDCAPCFERECALGHTRCLNDIRPDQVLSVLA